MPPRIRTRASKALKENIDNTENKLKPARSNTKAPRKALADKTNSASDDASLEIPAKSKKISLKTGPNKNGEKKQVETKKKQIVKSKENVEPFNEGRPRRERKLPNRFVENVILNNLSNSKESPNLSLSRSTTTLNTEKTPVNKLSVPKNDVTEPSPFKTPSKVDSSLLASRPSRICRLPSRFEDHSISPHKYIPIQPSNASTPIQQSKAKPIVLLTRHEDVSHDVGKNVETKEATKIRPTRLAKVNARQKESNENTSDKSSPDSNNNAKGRSTRKKTTKTQAPPTKKPSPKKKTQSPIRKFLTPMTKFQSPINKTQSPIKKNSPKRSTNKKADKNLSFKLLGSKKKPQESENKDLDVYEFTFDPNEEPKPQKKKRKRTVTKKPASAAKPKKVVCKSIYDQNINKALAALKNAIQPGKTTEASKLPQITENSEEAENVQQSNAIKNVVQTNNVTTDNNMALNDTGKTSVHECNYPSIRVEDIAADIEPSIDHHVDLNYSPVNSPKSIGLTTPNTHQSLNHRETPERSVQNNDPLNLAEELSFFDEQPVASSSMNMSVRHPLASPWRVEFGNLPVKWPVNTYVKPNMTPAVESSFINPEDSINKKKHVYTNMLPQTNEMFPDIADTTPNLKQTSIISFIKEMAEKSAKKKRGRSVSPAKAIYQEIDSNNAEKNKNKKSGKKGESNKATDPTINTSEEISSSGNDTSNDKEKSKEERRNRKRKNNENICDLPAKSPRKQKDKDCTFFGFDESENQDENVSPVKDNNKPRSRSLRPRPKAVLQEINGPTRAVLPVSAKTKIATSSEVVNKVYEELKSAADAPVFLERNVNENETNLDPSMNDDSQSVHLFEDIEVVHHLKPTRKSYGKAKKVTFRQRSNSTSDSDTQGPVEEQNESTDYDDLADLTFEVPDVTEKKATKKRKPKKLRSKKEEKEAEAWAANFNSMCEDIEDFPLVVE